MNVELSVVMPCLNEAETLAACIRKARRFFREHGVDGEVVVADNGSTDGSQAIAVSEGAVVVPVEEKGYGSALMAGIRSARGRFVVMGDADDSYDFGSLQGILDGLRAGNDLVMGNRFRGGIEPGAMPFLHRYLGNPVLSFLGRLFFGSKIGDFHCGLRGFRKEAYEAMDLKTKGMEFASEMVVKATIRKMRVAEVPIVLYPDGRSRPPHLRTWRDGWRHVRFLLLYSPKWLFFYPGLGAMLIGLIASALLLAGPVRVGAVVFDVHSLLYSTFLMLVGYQFVTFYVLAKVFAVNHGLLPRSPRFDDIFRFLTLEKGLLAGMSAAVAGAVLTLYAVAFWSRQGFGSLEPTMVLRITIPAAFLVLVGIQTILTSFLLSLLGLKK